ncbi:alcohol dehydrogenase catalytic domain-containing protein [uncultured Anaerofustis sp.]|uniref:alcohol dehydrogenase catalytic domain-containing protein n=1 Tax=uncultured Anaerofustis sp. TaxID=904996 RepID=UPI0025CBB390|nr:alcohol dehydrogenase catalytic domain-containing protein [uncultured Anaerofustis sp.]
MKALVLKGKCKVDYEEIETPKCPKGGLLLKMEAVGLCGSDVRTYEFGHHNVEYPAVLGHENVGRIIEVSQGVEGYEVGERIMMHPGIPCGKCIYCHEGLHSLCENRQTYGQDLLGGMAEYMAVPKEGIDRGLILKVPKDIKSEDIVTVELLSSVLNAQENAGVGIDQTVVIIGTGPIGCLHSEISRLKGAKKIIMVDLKASRLEMCKQFSGTDFIDSSKWDPIEKVMELTGGTGADHVIVAAPSADAHYQGLRMLKKRGTLVLFGGLNKSDPWTKLDANLIHYRELTIKGAFGYGFSIFSKAFDIVCNKMLKGNIVTHVIPLKDMERGVSLIKKGEALKVVMKP